MIRLFATLLLFLCFAATAEAQRQTYLGEPAFGEFPKGYQGFSPPPSASHPVDYRAWAEAAAKSQVPTFLGEPTFRSFSEQDGGFEISLVAAPPIDYRIELTWPVFTDAAGSHTPKNMGGLHVRAPQGVVASGGPLERRYGLTAQGHRVWAGAWTTLIIRRGDQTHIEGRFPYAAINRLRTLGAEKLVVIIWGGRPGTNAVGSVQFDLPLSSIPAPAEKVSTGKIPRP